MTAHAGRQHATSRGSSQLWQAIPAAARVQFRVPEAVAAQAHDRARAEGKSLSELAREALRRNLAS